MIIDLLKMGSDSIGKVFGANVVPCKILLEIEKPLCGKGFNTEGCTRGGS